MPQSKHQIIRYQALDRCFRNKAKHYFIEDLIDACQTALYNHTGNPEGVKRRQIYDDISFMMSEAGYNAPIEKDKIGRKVYYYYDDVNFSINNQPLTEDEALELKETLIALNRFKGLPQFEWIQGMATRLEASFQLGTDANQVIEFEENEFLKGKEFIQPLYHAITNKEVLTINYDSFKSNDAINIELHPYYLKQYNNRWFIFGSNPQFENITNLALDRIVDITPANKAYIPTDIDFREYFEDILGVTYDSNQGIHKVLLQIDTGLWPYVETKPIHGSQKVVSKNDTEVIIQLSVVLNYELESTLFQFGEKLTVIEPKELQEKMIERINKMLSKYNNAEQLHQ